MGLGYEVVRSDQEAGRGPAPRGSLRRLEQAAPESGRRRSPQHMGGMAGAAGTTARCRCAQRSGGELRCSSREGDITQGLVGSNRAASCPATPHTVWAGQRVQLGHTASPGVGQGRRGGVLPRKPHGSGSWLGERLGRRRRGAPQEPGNAVGRSPRGQLASVTQRRAEVDMELLVRFASGPAAQSGAWCQSSVTGQSLVSRSRPPRPRAAPRGGSPRPNTARGSQPSQSQGEAEKSPPPSAAPGAD